jgi:hypothetical protein
MKKISFFILWVFLLAIGSFSPSFSQASPNDIKGILKAAGESSDDNERFKLYQKVNSVPSKDPEDVKAIHACLKSLVPKIGDVDIKQGKKKVQQAESLSVALAQSISPDLQGTVRELLEEENNSLPQDYVGPYGAKTQVVELREGIQWTRIKALIRASGKGKNESALPVLREIFKKRGISGQEAALAIGQIGKPEDLREFIQIIENDPQARINLSGFGQTTFDVIMDEYNNPGVLQKQKTQLLGNLPQIASPDYLQKYLKLLEKKDPHLVSIGAERISNFLQPEDHQLIENLIANPNLSISLIIVASLGRMMDKPQCVKLAIGIVGNKKCDYELRLSATNYLGRAIIEKDKVVKALTEASQNDPVPAVREQARYSLGLLNKGL